MKDDLQIIEITQESMESMIYEIRGQKVMLDFDLAKIYGYETKYLNRQVQRNIEKFPNEFMFQLNEKEFKKTSWCQNVTLNKSGNLRGFNIKYLPKATPKLEDAFIDDFKNNVNQSLTILPNNNRFHDRYIFIDHGTDNETIYHCGASSKDAGNRITTINKLDDKATYKDLISSLFL